VGKNGTKPANSFAESALGLCMNTLQSPTMLLHLVGSLQVAVLAGVLEKPRETLERFDRIASGIPSTVRPPYLTVLGSLLAIHTARWTLGVLPRAHELVLRTFSEMLSVDSARFRDRYHVVLAAIRRALDQPDAPIEVHTEPRVTAALLFVRLNCCNHSLRLDDVARAVNVSRSHLEHLMKRHTGCPFKVHVRQARIHAACRLLESTTLTVKEVAGRVGYPHVSELTRDFRLVLNTAPRAWRHSLDRKDAASWGHTSCHSPDPEPASATTASELRCQSRRRGARPSRAGGAPAL
jgi:AraC-like DNA-binding protein